MRTSARIVGIAASLCLVWGCSSDTGGPSTPNGPTPPGSGDQAPLVIDIVGNRGSQSFAPNPATIPDGRTIVWRNSDTEIHRVRSNDQSFDTGNIPPGGSSQPLTVGTSVRPYHCPLHPGMVGTLNDGQGGEQPPPCQPGDLYC